MILGLCYIRSCPSYQRRHRVASAQPKDRIMSKMLLSLLVLSACTSLYADELTHTRFYELLKEVRPAADEPWRTIPWKLSLIDAQNMAAQDNKPIFIWAMDGHPLGCT